MFGRLNDNALKAEANNFTLVRLILSSSVIYTHCYQLAYGLKTGDELHFLLGADISVLAVDGFFFLSGFLVYPSLIRFNQSLPFLMARAARLWPGLMASILLTVLAGAFITSASGLDYLKGDTAEFVLLNGGFLKGAYNLTGVTCDGAPCAVNGSLWTLPWEARCYLILAALGVLGLARPKIMTWFILPATLACAVLWHLPGVREIVEAKLGAGVVFNLDVLDRLWPLFALGAGAYLFKDKLPLSWLVLAFLFGLLLAANQVGLGLHVRGLFIGYAILCCGVLTANKGAISGKWPDYSYGIYIYAYPTMLVAAHILQPASHWPLIALNFALTLPLAMASWHVVEKPAMDGMKRWRKARRAPAIPAA